MGICNILYYDAFQKWHARSFGLTILSLKRLSSDSYDRNSKNLFNNCHSSKIVDGQIKFDKASRAIPTQNLSF